MSPDQVNDVIKFFCIIVTVIVGIPLAIVVIGIVLSGIMELVSKQRQKRMKR